MSGWMNGWEFNAVNFMAYLYFSCGVMLTCFSKLLMTKDDEKGIVLLFLISSHARDY